MDFELGFKDYKEHLLLVLSWTGLFTIIAITMPTLPFPYNMILVIVCFAPFVGTSGPLLRAVRAWFDALDFFVMGITAFNILYVIWTVGNSIAGLQRSSVLPDIIALPSFLVFSGILFFYLMYTDERCKWGG